MRTPKGEELDQVAVAAVRLMPVSTAHSGEQLCHSLFFKYFNTRVVGGKRLLKNAAMKLANQEGWCGSQTWKDAQQACGYAWAPRSSEAAQAALAAGEDPKAAMAGTVGAQLTKAKTSKAYVPLT